MTPFLTIAAGTVYGAAVPLPPYQITGDEVAWAGGTVGPRLNTEVKNAAAAHGWTLITGIDDDQGNLFSGHGYCATQSWIRHAHDATLLEGPLGQMLPPPDSARTKGTLHPTATGLWFISAKIVAAAKPDLLTPASAAPSAPPSITTASGADGVGSVQGGNGWLLGGCATGTPCPAAFTIDAGDVGGLHGAGFTVNGAAATCPNPAPGLTCNTSTSTDSSNRITAEHWDFRAADRDLRPRLLRQRHRRADLHLLPGGQGRPVEPDGRRRHDYSGAAGERLVPDTRPGHPDWH